MCNAWNHPPGCTCGWGGVGHLGARGVNNEFYSTQNNGSAFRLSRAKLLEGYTNPNAKCPVCGESVFFYDSPTGGRVFFDELGPPWPKHPCTDNGGSLIRISEKADNHLNNKISRYKWQFDGWKPLLMTSIVGVDKELTRVNGEVEGNEIELYVIKHQKEYLFEHSLIDVNAPALFKRRNHHFILSSISVKGEVVEIVAFSSMLDARVSPHYTLPNAFGDGGVHGRVRAKPKVNGRKNRNVKAKRESVRGDGVVHNIENKKHDGFRLDSSLSDEITSQLIKFKEELKTGRNKKK